MPTRWVSFDCFGTLVDWNGGFSKILTPVFGSQTREVLRAYHGFERELEAQRPHRRYKEVLAGALSLAAAKAGIPISEGESRILQQSWASLPVFPDVEEMLAGLRTMGCQLAVLTNCDDDLFELTQRNFRMQFDLVVTAEQIGAYKPSLAHFHSFAEASGVALGDWVHVACSWYHDIAPAKALGVRRIWLDRELTGEDANAASVRVRSASEVSSAIAKFYHSSFA